MTFDPFAEEPAPEEVETMVDDAIASNEVVLFMKGDRLMPQCGFSQRAVELISRHRDEFETVDVLPALGSFRASLEEHSGWETIPQTFVDGEFVGGSDILAELESRDELAATLHAD
ncbi:glutaredoxin family protein [Halobacteriaceae archaeon GCM10025711]